MVNGFKALLFVTVTGIMAASCVKGDNPIQRYEDPRNGGQGGVPILGPGWSKVNVQANFWDVFFVNDTLGFLAGDAGVYRSGNGGETWSKTNAKSNVSYINMFFLDEKYGWAVSNNKELAITEDSGKNWTNSSSGYAIFDVYFRDAVNGYAAANEGVLKSTDGGKSWTLMQGSPGESLSVYFVDEQIGFCGTKQNGYWRTTNGGTSFVRATGLPNLILKSQFFSGPDAQKGIAIGSDGYINKTIDNGGTWTKGPKITGRYFDFDFKDFENGFVMTENNVNKVEGNTVTKVLYRPVTADYQFSECHFNTDQTKGWVIHNGGELYRYVKP